MRIAWLCHYSLHYLKDSVDVLADASRFHPTTWIHYLIEEVRKRPDIELHVVTTSPYVKNDCSCVHQSVHFHILRRGIPILHKGLPQYFRWDILTDYFLLRRKIRRLLQTIRPHIVTAHGTEDVFGYSLKDIHYPSVVWIQGLINQVVKESDSYWLQKQSEIENRVFQHQPDFISNCSVFDPVIMKHNPNARIHYLSYPVANEAFALKSEHVDADIAFAGSVIKRKGIEDLLDATALVKSVLPYVKVKVVGGSGDASYDASLKRKTHDLGIEDNIAWLGFLPNHGSVLKEISTTKIFVLPTHVDTGPRAVAESMALRVPVISYDVDGLPWMIEDGRRGILVHKGNVEALAASIVRLLEDDAERKRLADAAYLFARKEFYAPTIVDNLMKIYNNVIASYEHPGKRQ